MISTVGLRTSSEEEKYTGKCDKEKERESKRESESESESERERPLETTVLGSYGAHEVHGASPFHAGLWGHGTMPIRTGSATKKRPRKGKEGRLFGKAFPAFSRFFLVQKFELPRNDVDKKSRVRL